MYSTKMVIKIENEVICLNAETCNKTRCKHIQPHEMEDECYGHFCEKHLKDMECDDVD